MCQTSISYPAACGHDEVFPLPERIRHQRRDLSYCGHRHYWTWHRDRQRVLRLPGIFAAVVVIELARMIWAKRIDKPPHGSHALLRQQRRLGAAHIGPDPSGINQNAGNAAGGEIARCASHHHIHGCLGAAIGNEAARRIIGERAHAARDGDHQPEYSRRRHWPKNRSRHCLWFGQMPQ